MWPLYDPSMYQPPSPTKRMTQAEFVAALTELEHKPDVDNVFEAMSSLQEQVAARPVRMTIRRFLIHPFMIFPAASLLACAAIVVVQWMQDAPTGARMVRQLTRSPDVLRGGSPLFVMAAVLAALLVAARAGIRDKDPDVLAMRAAAAASIARMATNPKYIHEPFSSNDEAFLRRLLKGRSAEADRALVVLMSHESTAREPDPEFRGGER